MNKFDNKTIAALHKEAAESPAGNYRAQCYAIASYVLESGQSIADKFLSEHVFEVHAYRHAMVMVHAGCATLNQEMLIIKFEDGSEIG